MEQGNRVRELRRERGWSQEALSRAADVTLRTIVNVDKGKRCHVGTAVKIAKALGFPRTRWREVFPALLLMAALGCEFEAGYESKPPAEPPPAYVSRPTYIERFLVDGKPVLDCVRYTQVWCMVAAPEFQDPTP